MASLMMGKSRGLVIISVFALGLVFIGPAKAQGWSSDAHTFGTGGQGADPTIPNGTPTGAQGWSSSAHTFGTSGQGADPTIPSGSPTGAGGWSSDAHTFGTSQGNYIGTPTVPSGRPGGGTTIRGKK